MYAGMTDDNKVLVIDGQAVIFTSERDLYKYAAQTQIRSGVFLIDHPKGFHSQEVSIC